MLSFVEPPSVRVEGLDVEVEAREVRKFGLDAGAMLRKEGGLGRLRLR